MRNPLLTLVTAGPLVLAGFAPGSAADCTFKKLSIEPVAADGSDVFAGAGRSVRVEFKNISNRNPVTVFPEPPLTIRQLKSNKSCEIDGGVWQRDSVFLSSDETVLIVLEFSGNANQLTSYNTGSCTKLGNVDVSDARWKVDGRSVIVGRQCANTEVSSCRKRNRVSLTRFCGMNSGVNHER